MNYKMKKMPTVSAQLEKPLFFPINKFVQVPLAQIN